MIKPQSPAVVGRVGKFEGDGVGCSAWHIAPARSAVTFADDEKLVGDAKITESLGGAALTIMGTSDAGRF
ncbi:hypothetical protein ACFQ1S_02280 [Kibdelosporangium lantanae]|uniref:Uncharacterized protein n=1 Tax=Kibdelosporangium lantanae TaxID=1497396 RepID=A0ABW3M3J9_9PSEU